MNFVELPIDNLPTKKRGPTGRRKAKRPDAGASRKPNKHTPVSEIKQYIRKQRNIGHLKDVKMGTKAHMLKELKARGHYSTRRDPRGKQKGAMKSPYMEWVHSSAVQDAEVGQVLKGPNGKKYRVGLLNDKGTYRNVTSV